MTKKVTIVGYVVNIENTERLTIISFHFLWVLIEDRADTCIDLNWRVHEIVPAVTMEKAWGGELPQKA